MLLLLESSSKVVIIELKLGTEMAWVFFPAGTPLRGQNYFLQLLLPRMQTCRVQISIMVSREETPIVSRILQRGNFKKLDTKSSAIYNL